METEIAFRETSRLVPVAQIIAVVCLIPVGLTLGALTGWVVLSPIMGMVVPLLAATWFLKREGKSWHDVGFANRMSISGFLGFTALTVVSVYVLVGFGLQNLLEAIGLPPQDTSSFKQLIEGNTLYFLAFLLPVSWGSAAFGEELLLRGFVRSRLEWLTRSPVLAVIGQAAIFALAHLYQGITGVLMVFSLGLIFGAIFYRCGRNLWPLIAAHGLIDTFAMTSIYLGLDWV